MSEYKLTLKGIHHVYGNKADDETEAIKHIDLNVRDGEFLAIVGASGCGKSTLLNIMCGMIEPSEGEVLIDGDSISSGKHRIGYISQTDTLLPWRKIESNVALGLEIEGISKKERLEQARKMPITFDEDCPEISPEKAIKFRRVNPPHRLAGKSLA